MLSLLIVMDVMTYSENKSVHFQDLNIGGNSKAYLVSMGSVCQCHSCLQRKKNSFSASHDRQMIKY